MNQIFQRFLSRFVAVLFNDILVYGRSEKEHYDHLKTILRVLLHNELFVKQRKCSFYQSSVEYLGHIASKRGVKADPKKIDALLSWQAPVDLK